MSDLTPVAFDIETSGLDREAVVTVAGFGHELGYWLFLNTAGRDARTATLERGLQACVTSPVSLTVVSDERALLEATDRFETGEVRDLVGVYERLVGGGSWDPFEDSGRAVEAFDAGEWLALLQHNLADVRRTCELAELAGRFVPSSDFQMKNLAPPQRR